MKVLVISDEESKYLSEYYNENDLESVDFVLSAGDLPYSYLEAIKVNLKKPLFRPGQRRFLHFCGAGRGVYLPVL